MDISSRKKNTELSQKLKFFWFCRNLIFIWQFSSKFQLIWKIIDSRAGLDGWNLSHLSWVASTITMGLVIISQLGAKWQSLFLWLVLVIRSCYGCHLSFHLFDLGFVWWLGLIVDNGDLENRGGWLMINLFWASFRNRPEFEPSTTRIWGNWTICTVLTTTTKIYLSTSQQNIFKLQIMYIVFVRTRF